MKIHAAHRLLAESIMQYVQRLGSEGVKRLGSEGGYAHVFQHPTIPNVAVKLLHDNDPAYMEYVKFCKGPGKGNPYCPKIIQLVEDGTAFTGKWDPDLTLVFMEKLNPVTDKDYLKFATYLMAATRVNNYASPIGNKEAATNFLNDRDTWSRLAKQKHDLDLAQIARLFQTLRPGYLLDMHDKNVMKRGSQMVITDPFSS